MVYKVLSGCFNSSLTTRYYLFFSTKHLLKCTAEIRQLNSFPIGSSIHLHIFGFYIFYKKAIFYHYFWKITMVIRLIFKLIVFSHKNFLLCCQIIRDSSEFSQVKSRLSIDLNWLPTLHWEHHCPNGSIKPSVNQCGMISSQCTQNTIIG